MKECKYCKKPGIFDPVLRRILCEEHRSVQRNIRSLWESVAHIQLEMLRGK